MISIKDLRVKYKNTVIENFNLKIEENGIYCLFAPSGAGKTTLLNAVSKLIKFDGEIIVDGEISYLFQEDRLLNWFSAKENVMLVEPDKEKAEYYMTVFGVDEFADKKPQELSGGMKRRCALARALAFEADVYLLDEPFRGLDEQNADLVRKEIIELGKEKIVILVTHDELDLTKLNAKRINLI